MLSDVELQFLTEMHSAWPRSSEEELCSLLPEERELIAQLDKSCRETEIVQLGSIIEQMKFPSHLAIQYVLLKDDFHRTLGKMRADKPGVRKEMHDALCEAFERNMNYKMWILERWYIHLRQVSGDKLTWDTRDDIARAMEFQGRRKMKGCAAKLNPTLPLLVILVVFLVARICLVW